MQDRSWLYYPFWKLIYFKESCSHKHRLQEYSRCIILLLSWDFINTLNLKRNLIATRDVNARETELLSKPERGTLHIVDVQITINSAAVNRDTINTHVKTSTKFQDWNKNQIEQTSRVLYCGWYVGLGRTRWSLGGLLILGGLGIAWSPVWRKQQGQSSLPELTYVALTWECRKRIRVLGLWPQL